MVTTLYTTGNKTTSLNEFKNIKTVLFKNINFSAKMDFIVQTINAYLYATVINDLYHIVCFTTIAVNKTIDI